MRHGVCQRRAEGGRKNGGGTPSGAPQFPQEKESIHERSDNQKITLKLNDIAHLFVASEFDPFSDQEAGLLGQPALVHVLRQLGPRTVKDGHPFCLTLQLPPDKMTPNLKARTAQALRYVATMDIIVEPQHD